MNLKTLQFLASTLSLMLSACSSQQWTHSWCGLIEVPVFERSDEGRRLQQFISTRRTALLVVQTYSGTVVLPNIQQLVFSVIDDSSYLRLIDLSKRKPPDFDASLPSVLSNSRNLGRAFSADLILHVQLGRPACTPSMMRFPISATLIRTDTAESLSVRSLEHAGNSTIQCNPERVSRSDISVSFHPIKAKLVPPTRACDALYARRDPNPEVGRLLDDGYQEQVGEIPNFERSLALWSKALDLSKGTSIGALGNLAHLDFARGEYSSAVQRIDAILRIIERLNPCSFSETARRCNFAREILPAMSGGHVG